MEKAILNRDNVFNALEHLSAFNHYLKDYHNYPNLETGKHISNPFISSSQETPSFNIYRATNNCIKYKDFATGDSGDIFDLVQRLLNCSFSEALEKLNNDFNLGLYSKKEESDFNIEFFSDWPPYALEYWKQFGIPEKVLNSYKVFCVKNYTLKRSKAFTVNSSEHQPVFAYQVSENCFKIYQPFNLKHKFTWLGIKPNDYVFGLTQLSDTRNTVYIAAGEKDTMAIANTGTNAICLNSETSIPSSNLIKHLNNRFKEVIILYDLDETGLKQSKKLCELYGLSRLLLPEKIKTQNGKDFADYIAQGNTFSLANFKKETFQKKQEQCKPEFLEPLLELKEQIRFSKSRRISRPTPILFRGEQEIIFPNTINIIQGKAGVHKSRLAETICSAFIKQDNAENIDLLGFKTNIVNRPTVCYVDTERNLTDQFPYALQQINIKAGYKPFDEPENLDYISLLNISRTNRFKALNEYLQFVKNKQPNQHIVIVLDVITDCINDFNRADDSMQLIDLLNTTINFHNVTFICLIHENPGSADKARGHIGTELMNKASTVMQVSFEKGQNNKPTDLIALNFLKKRNTKRYDTIYLKYCSVSGGLVGAEKDDIEEVFKDRSIKAREDDIIKYIAQNPFTKISSSDLISDLVEEFVCSDKIIRERLKYITDNELVITMPGNLPSILYKEKEGRNIYYLLNAA